MVIFPNYYQGVKFEYKVNPVEKIPRMYNDNNKREFYEQKKNDAKSCAYLLRANEKRTINQGISRIC